ncbi:MAG: S41 family peptidase [Gaiellaceae bacterium]
MAAAVSGSFLVGLRVTGGSQTEPAAAADLVRERLAARYYKPVPRRLLRLRNVESMLAGLHDPYTEYLEPFAYSELRRQTSASYSGIGATVLPQRDGFVVSAVPAGPARRSGLRPGDTIVTIDGALARRLTFERALGRLLGPRGTVVRLGVRRGGRLLRFDVERGEIRTAAVSSRLLAAEGRRVGYVALHSFSSGTAQLLGVTVARLERARAAGLVLDLRNNPGGLLDQAVAVSSLFLAEGRIVSIEGAHEPVRVFMVERRPGASASALPLVVLVNRYTASAAEVVAAALRDNRRATLVGEVTFGKAVVQSIEPLPNGAALKLTTARYLTPAGADISSEGLKPHLEAVDDAQTPEDEALAAALDTLPAVP